MSWKFYSLQNSLGSYRLTWDAMNDELCRSNPFGSADFVETMLTFFAEGNEQLCIYKNADQIEAMLILSPVSNLKWRLFNPDQAQIGTLLVREQNSLTSLVSSLPGIVLGVDITCQDPLISPVERSNSKFPVITAQHTHTMTIELEGSFDDYWKSRTSNLRKSIMRRMRRLQELGIHVRIEYRDMECDMPTVVDRFGDMESSGWKGVNGTSVHCTNIQGQFYSELMTRFARRGMAAVYELYFNDALVAMQLCVAGGDSLVLLKTTYDESLSNHAPGRLLLYLLLEHEFRQKRFRNIEFYTNANKDQLAWASSDRWINHHLLLLNKQTRYFYQAVKWAAGLKRDILRKLKRTEDRLES